MKGVPDRAIRLRCCRRLVDNISLSSSSTSIARDGNGGDTTCFTSTAAAAAPTAGSVFSAAAAPKNPRMPEPLRAAGAGDVLVALGVGVTGAVAEEPDEGTCTGEGCGCGCAGETCAADTARVTGGTGCAVRRAGCALAQRMGPKLYSSPGKQSTKRALDRTELSPFIGSHKRRSSLHNRVGLCACARNGTKRMR